MQKFHLSTHADISSQAGDLKFGPNLHLHPYFVCVSSNSYWEPVHLRMLASVFDAGQCDKYDKLKL